MNKNILKYFGLAALLALGANAMAATVAKIGTAEYETLADAFAKAKDGDTVNLLAASYTENDLGAIGKLNKKKVVVVGLGMDKTELKVVYGQGASDVNGLHFQDLTLTINHSGYGMPYTQTLCGTYERVKFNGLIAVDHDTSSFTDCVFTGTTTGDEYILWQYGGVMLVERCTFEKCASKGVVKLYCESSYEAQNLVKDCVFESVTGSKGCAIYASNSNNLDKPIYEMNIVGNTIPDGVAEYLASGNGLTVVNPVKDANGKITSGTFITANTNANQVKGIIAGVVAEGVEVPELVNGQVVIKGWEEPTAVVEVTDAAGKTKKYATLAEAFAATPWVEKPVNGCTVRLLADIDLAGVAWTPVSFCGTFDGNSKTISNLKVQDSSGCAGFFGKFRGTATNVTFEVADVTGSNYAAVFAAEVSNAGGSSDANLKMLIGNVTIKNSVVKGVQKCGGVIGRFPESDGSIEIRGCHVDTLSILGKDSDGVWQAGGLVGYLQTMIAANAYIHDNTVKNITIADANVEYFKTDGYAHDFFSSAFIGDVVNYKKLNEGGSKEGTVILENNTVAGTNDGYQIGPKSNTYVGDYRMQDEVGGNVEKVCKIEVDGVDITVPVPPEVVPVKPTESETKEATKVVDDKGEVVTPTPEQEAAAKTEVEKVVQSFDNPEIAKVETHVAEAAMTVTGGDEPQVVVKPSVVEKLREAAPAGTEDQITSESDVKSYVKIALAEAKVTVVAAVAELNSVAFDVKPIVETTIVSDEGATVVEAEVPDAEIAANPVTFRLPITDDFAMSAKVRHVSEDTNYPPEEFVRPVLGAAGGRYVEITTTHFSTFTLSPYNAVVTESDETLGIVKVAKTASGETVAGVPFKKFDATSGTAKAMTVDQLLVAGFGMDDDIYAYNPTKPSGDEYDMWAWDGEKWDIVPGPTQPPAAESAEIASGKAFWFKDESDSATPLTLAGLYQENVTTAVDAGKKSLLVNPYPMAINAAEKLKEGACTGDQFALVGGNVRYEFRDGAWGVVTKGEVVRTLAGGAKIYGPDTFTAKDVIEIPAGQAFWYISTGATAPTVAW